MVARQDLGLCCEEHPRAVIALFFPCRSAWPRTTWGQPNAPAPAAASGCGAQMLPPASQQEQPCLQGWRQRWAPACKAAGSQAAPLPPTDGL